MAGDHEHEIGALAEMGVGNGVGLGPQGLLDGLRRQRRERHLTHEAGGVVGEDGDDVGAGVDQAAAHLDRLVGGDATGDTQDDGLARGRGRRHVSAPGSLRGGHCRLLLAGLRLIRLDLATASGTTSAGTSE